jgi:hypothetical protein
MDRVSGSRSAASGGEPVADRRQIRPLRCDLLDQAIDRDCRTEEFGAASVPAARCEEVEHTGDAADLCGVQPFQAAPAG